MKLGADLSYHQGYIDWSKVKLDFVILREGYRQTTDTRFFEYVKGCTKVGIPILGVYHFSYALNADQAKQEAVLAVKNVQKAGLSKDTIIFFDFEYDTVDKAKKAGVNLGKKQCMEHTKVFCEEVTRQGYRAGIYANRDYYKNYYDKSLIDKYIFWLAHYTTGKPAYPCYLCQFTSSGHVNGISGNVDLNRLYGVEPVKTGKKTRSRLLNQAKSWIGLKESDGSFKTIIDTYNSHTPLARGYKLTYKDSWCSAFVSACAIKTGMTDIIPTECGCERHIELFKKLGVWVEKDDYVPDPADIIFYDWDDVQKSGDTVGYADHVGIVEKCDDKTITVIEGNKNDAVGRRTIGVGAKTIRGFAVPRFDQEQEGGEPVGFQCINYLKKTGDGAEKVFRKVVELKCKHSAIASWDEMVNTRSISCSSSGSVALQLAGCLDKGKKIGHVPTKGIKESSIKTIDDAMFGRTNLKHCRVIWTGGCRYKDLPYWLKRRGVVYIQWSNCCTCAGDGWIWSTNEEGGYHRQSDGSMRYDQYKETKNRSGVLSNGGHYPWGGTIFVCLVPDEKWDQHFAVEVMLEKHGKKETRQDHFGSHYEQIQKMVDKMCRNHDYFCRWSADVILEKYLTIDDFYKKGSFDYRQEVQEMVDDIKKYAHEVWAGKHGDLEQRKKDFPDLWEQIQKQVNRTTS